MAFTTEERLDLIARLGKVREEQLNRANELELKEREELKARVLVLCERVDTLLMLANACITNKIQFPGVPKTRTFGWGFGESDFYLNEVEYLMGFVGKPTSADNPVPLTYIGIKSKGTDGFYINGKGLHPCKKPVKTAGGISNHSRDVLPKKRDMERFLAQFGTFEKAFYKWIDSFQKEIEN